MWSRVLALSLVLTGSACPADGPLEPAPDLGSAEDMERTGDADEEAAVSLDAIEPETGSIDGGTEVTLTGSGFVDGMTIRFGSGMSVEATVSSDAEATATTPASPTAGTVTVVVRTPDGETDSLLNGFEYEGGDGPDASLGFCQLQAQSPASTTTGVASDGLFALVFAEGITQGAGQGSAITGELGYGEGDDPTAFTYVSMNYNEDKDGLNSGDLANDEYGASLTISAAGTYRYAARFKLGDGDWLYCDLDGTDAGSDVDPSQLGTIEVTDPPTPTVGFCQTNTASVRVESGSATDTIEGQVFVAGATPGNGAGEQVVGEIVWGPAGSDPTGWADSAAATYAGDRDGLAAGDLANDIWEGTITEGTEGDYGYMYRFSPDGGTTWQLCDIDGSTGPDDVDANLAGDLEVRDVLVDLPDACNLQFPQIVGDSVVPQPIEFYGRLTEAGVTGDAGLDAAVRAELAVGPPGVDPSVDDSAFSFTGATRNTTAQGLAPDEDEFSVSYTPTTAGEYAFAFRFSVDDGNNWRYCGLVDEPAQSGSFGAESMGWLHVADAAPLHIDFCHVWQDTVADQVSAANPPTITVEVFEDPLTIDNGGSQSADLTVEVAAMGVEINPALYSGSWKAIDYKGLRPGVPNNYEYEGTLYDAASQPGAGSYNVFARVRQPGTLIWTYCDTDEASTEVRLEAATRLTLSP